METYKRIFRSLNKALFTVETNRGEVTLRLWWIIVAVIIFSSVAATNYMTQGFTDVGPWVGGG